jgi:SAM-dependent methyltransferase
MMIFLNFLMLMMIAATFTDRKLNLGAGKDIRSDYINVDYKKFAGIDVVHNLNKIPYPFKDNKFDEILMMNILEHLDNPLEIMMEIHRISRDGALVTINVPHFSSPTAWGDLEHRKPYSYFTFDKKTNNIPFEIVSRKLLFNRMWRYLGISFLANTFPSAYEKLFAFHFQCNGLSFILKAVKSPIDVSKNNNL